MDECLHEVCEEPILNLSILLSIYHLFTDKNRKLEKSFFILRAGEENKLSTTNIRIIIGAYIHLKNKPGKLSQSFVTSVNLKIQVPL